MHVLRSAPLRIWAIYLIGALPYSLVLTYFISDMSRSAFAAEQLADLSFGVAVAFLWKQSWQAVFAAELYGIVEGARHRWNWTRLWRMIALQCAIQPWSLIVLPISLVTVFPFPYAMGFFRNLTVYAGLGNAKPVRTARTYASLWTAQSWGLLSVFSLLGLLLFVNYLVTLAIVPQLLKSFFGIENLETRYAQWVLNPTVMTATAILVYLSLDGLLDVVYVLRCFYGEAIATGIDLRAGLRRALSMVALLVCISGTAATLMIAPSAVYAAEAPAANPIDRKKLEHAIDEVVHRREFTWNSPKTDTERDEGKLAGWARSVWKSIRRFVNWLVEWIQRVFFPEESGSEAGGGSGRSATIVRWLLIALGIAFVLAIVYIFYRQRQTQLRRQTARPIAAKPVIDLKDESVTADQLPEDSWYSLARECIDKGDFRLALRAFYLGSISHLGRRELVVIERWKSGLDYGRELARRTRSTPEAAPAFSKAVRIFESGWYGRHSVDQQTINEFAADFDEVKRRVG